MSANCAVISAGNHVILRDRYPTDVDYFLKIQTSGQWREFDAPWEGIRETLTRDEVHKYREKFLADLSLGNPSPRRLAVIATHDGLPFGSVSRYTLRDHAKAWFIGIDIFEDENLNRGYGTEALRLWINYLFDNSDVHRIGLDTWSFNARMIRVAGKLGLVHEGTQREMQEWQGRWLDLMHFGLLRIEWEKLRNR